MKVKTQGATLTALTAMAAMAIAAGTANADPVNPDPQQRTMTVDLAPGVQYTGNVAENAAVVRTPIGSIAMRAGQIGIQDAAGNALYGAPVQAIGPTSPADTGAAASAPAAASVADSTEAAAAPVARQAQPVGDFNADLHAAVEAADGQMGLAMGLGVLGGSLIGIAVGCPIGIATGGTLMALASVGTLTLPALVAGCVVGATAVGGLGATVGGVVAALPVGIATGVATFNQLQAQHGTPAQTAPAAG
ncbi:hypothetical protein [Nocardia sp. alder85J]|uniref:hypothetical protein n=1 Tax=Nocardia sp. alder85J TaxID=2862949 RepID=UPI001CD5B59B|nr:hypothetical protein [Nocardia sp. alder85J]MCX4090834.1 hypothetical protein [Nocardia sp. alder85J]